MNFKIKFLSLVFVVIFLSSAFCKNIAVIPFTNITDDANKNWIGAGFGSTLTTKLGKVKSINLIEREQLQKILNELNFQYSGFVDDNTAVKIGKMFGVDVLVLGEFQIMDNTLRVNARFVSVQTAKIIDTSEVTGELKNIFTLQDEIAFKLIDSINIVLAEKEKEEIKINPTENLDAYEWLAKGNIADDLDIAIEYYTNAIKLDIELAEAYLNRGRIYVLKGNIDSAISDYNKAIQLNPQDAYAYYQRGHAYLRKNFDSAISDYSKAIQLDPTGECRTGTKGTAYNSRGIAYELFKGDIDSAIKDYTKVIELNSPSSSVINDANNYLNRGNAYYKKGSYDKAITDYNKAIQLDPQYPTLYASRGQAYYKKGNYDKAIADYNKAIQLYPQFDGAYTLRGNAYGKKGNCQKANTDYKKACSLGYNEACSYKCK